MNNQSKKKNAIARDLRTPKYRVRVVKDRTKYTRKGKSKIQIYQ